MSVSSPKVRELSAPASLEAVDTVWLSQALSQKFPGLVVEAMERGTVIRGMATKAQFRLRYSMNGAVVLPPEMMWLKCGFEAHSERSIPLYAAEVNFYRHVAATLPVNCPQTYFASIDPDTGTGILLMEDLTQKGVIFGQPGEAITIEQARNLLSQLAAIHVLPRTGSGQLDWLKGGGAIDKADVVGEFFGHWQTASRQPRFQFVTGALLDRPRMMRAVRKMRALDQALSDKWFVHGDSHTGNMYFQKNGEIGLLDWQTAMLGHWAADVSYALTMTLTVEDRRRHEAALIRHYLDCLSLHCPEEVPAFDEAWLAYRQHQAWCFLTVLCPVEKQPETVCLRWAERACAAIEDLETLKSLED